MGEEASCFQIGDEEEGMKAITSKLPTVIGKTRERRRGLTSENGGGA